MGRHQADASEQAARRAAYRRPARSQWNLLGVCVPKTLANDIRSDDRRQSSLLAI
jgi:hypothetical protein